MDFIIWIIILTFFILSFIGLVFPFLPSVLAIWAGFLLYHFVINASTLTWFFWVSMGALTILLLLADILAGSITVKRFGGSKLGERVATFSIIVGSFVYPPFGIILLPFIAVFIAEYWQKNTGKEAFKAAAGSLIGFLSGRVAELVIQLIMIIWFSITIWL